MQRLELAHTEFELSGTSLERMVTIGGDLKYLIDAHQGFIMGRVPKAAHERYGSPDAFFDATASHRSEPRA